VPLLLALPSRNTVCTLYNHPRLGDTSIEGHRASLRWPYHRPLLETPACRRSKGANPRWVLNRPNPLLLLFWLTRCVIGISKYKIDLTSTQPVRPHSQFSGIRWTGLTWQALYWLCIRGFARGTVRSVLFLGPITTVDSADARITRANTRRGSYGAIANSLVRLRIFN
jgi:hypothetical protein